MVLAMGACMCVPTLWHASQENFNLLPARFHLTDHDALDVCSIAGQTLTANINALQTLGYNGGIPTPQIDGFDIPRELVAEANVIIIGSPHGHLSDGTHYTSESSRQFKHNLIVSLQYQDYMEADSCPYLRTGSNRTDRTVGRPSTSPGPSPDQCILSNLSPTPRPRCRHVTCVTR